MTDGELPRGYGHDDGPTEALPAVDMDTVPGMERLRREPEPDTAILARVPGLMPMLGAGLILAVQTAEYREDRKWADDGEHERTMPLLARDLATGHHQEYLTTQVGVVRSALAGLQPGQRVLLEPYLRRLAADHVFGGRHAQRPPGAARSQSLIEWLASRAEDTYVAEFIEAHAAELAGQTQHPEVNQAIADEKTLCIANIQDMVARGYHDPHAASVLPLLRRAEVRFGDVWDTVLLGRTGYQYRGTYYVVLAPSIEETAAADKAKLLTTVRRVTVHELDHVVFRSLPYIFMEGMAQHDTVVAHHGDPDTIDPDRRADGDRVYRGIRRLIHFMSTEGLYPLPSALWMRAHTSGGPNSASSQELRRHVLYSCGVDLAEVDEYCGTLTDALQLRPEFARESRLIRQRKAVELTTERTRQIMADHRASQRRR